MLGAPIDFCPYNSFKTKCTSTYLHNIVLQIHREDSKFKFVKQTKSVFEGDLLVIYLDLVENEPRRILIPWLFISRRKSQLRTLVL